MDSKAISIGKKLSMWWNKKEKDTLKELKSARCIICKEKVPNEGRRPAKGWVMVSVERKTPKTPLVAEQDGKLYELRFYCPKHANLVDQEISGE